MSDLKCSFVIPGHKCDETVFRNVDSILDQDFRNYEVIVVLNGLWETKGELLKRLHETYGQKITVHSIETPGLGNANNFGFEHSTGDIISHLSSDLYLMPGALRNWVEAFNEHPDCDLVYSGYKIVSDNPRDIYYANPFNRHHLECENYIDGANPYRRKAARRWNTELKSLIDWDFALSLTDDGAKGHWIEEPMYYAEPPKAGGLSEDSNKNWVRRRREIQNLHHIPDRPICVTSPERYPFALQIAELCDFDFRVYPGHKPHEYSLIYSYGFPVGEESIQYSTGQFFHHFGHKAVHWTEADILSLLNWPMKDCIYYTDMVLKRISQHFCMNKKHQDNLSRLGIEAEVVFPPLKEVPKLPKQERSVSVSDEDILNQLKRAMPDIEFKLNDYSCSISVHFSDDITNTIKAVLSGCHVITNEYVPGVHHVEAFQTVPELRRILVHNIRQILRKNELPDESVISDYTEKTKASYFKKKLEKIAEKKVSKYARLMGLEAEGNA